MPARFKRHLKNTEAIEGGVAALSCELTKFTPVEWKKNNQSLQASEKYVVRQDGVSAELVIHKLDLSDMGDYTCVCGDQQTTASLTVNGKVLSMNTLQSPIKCECFALQSCNSKLFFCIFTTDQHMTKCHYKKNTR